MSATKVYLHEFFIRILVLSIAISIPISIPITHSFVLNFAFYPIFCSVFGFSFVFQSFPFISPLYVLLCSPKPHNRCPKQVFVFSHTELKKKKTRTQSSSIEHRHINK